MSLQDEWTLDIALQILQNPTVDSKLWAEAAEWLLRYGPPSIQKILLQASQAATELQFPELQPVHYTADGMPVYDTARLAETLGVSEEEVQQIIARKGLADELLDFRFEAEAKTIH